MYIAQLAQHTTFNTYHELLLYAVKKTNNHTWKYFVWNLVNAQPMRRSSSCLASTDNDSFLFGSPRSCIAFLMSLSVIAEKWARNIV